MAKLKSLEELNKLREELAKGFTARTETGIRIIIGMGTCGIAAGAKDTFGTLVDVLAEKGIVNVLVRQTGCMGLCHSEPTVEVVVPDMPTVIYGNVDTKVAREIVEKHIVARTLLDDHICDKPAIDIVK